jgi:hypothetical protein
MLGIERMRKIILCYFIILLSGSHAWASGIFSDYGTDNLIDGEDLLLFSRSYEIQRPRADLNRNNVINGDDVEIFAADFGKVNIFKFIYDVGPGQPYANPSEVPWESLQPGSLVRIHYRPQPYANKWVLGVSGTAEAPIVVRGIPENGRLPVITGENATTRMELDYWNENRSVIKIGGSSYPSQFPTHIIIENLDIRSARPPYTFIDDRGDSGLYTENAASVHVEIGDHITVRNCILHDSGNGFFSSSQSSNLLLEKNYVYDNGIEGSIYHHNSYTESLGIIFQFNRYGPLRAGCRGNNLKDRSAGTIIRYNWIEAGNRTLDLVDSDYTGLIDHPSYSNTYVYGNILIKHDVQENSQVLHYGGDSGNYDNYRKGTLWFYNNTVVSYRSGNTTLLGLDTNDESAEAFNNIVYVTAAGSRLAIMGEEGNVSLYHNWLTQGWRSVHGTLQGSLTAADNINGTFPGFNDFSDQDYSLASNSQCIGAGTVLPANLQPKHDLPFQYDRHQTGVPRAADDMIDIGAFEYE